MYCFSLPFGSRSPIYSSPIHFGYCLCLPQLNSCLNLQTLAPPALGSALPKKVPQGEPECAHRLLLCVCRNSNRRWTLCWLSVATYFGLLSAGLLLALQNVILASLGALLLVGKRLARHSVDFGLPVTLMTQVVSCRLLIARSVRKLLPPKCKLNRDCNAALVFRNSTVRWQRACLDNNRKGASGARSQGSPPRGP